jgi:hypothetical protein
LLINVDWLHGVGIFIVATIAMLLFAAATQGYFITRSRFYESILLLLIAFTLFRPGFWMDMIYPPYEELAPAQLLVEADKLAAGTPIRLHVDGLDEVGRPRNFVAILTLGEGPTGQDRLIDAGLELIESDGKLIVDNVRFNSAAAAAGLEFDQTVEGVLAPLEQPRKEWLWIPAFLVLGLLIKLQQRRARAAAPVAA